MDGMKLRSGLFGLLFDAYDSMRDNERLIKSQGTWKFIKFSTKINHPPNRVAVYNIYLCLQIM
jgi:hypothetical protein